MNHRINRHPSDDGNLEGYPVSGAPFLDDLRRSTLLVSRFSGCILEGLALGKPCVYYDSFGEPIPKFKKPLGAFSIATDRRSLRSSIVEEIENKDNVQVRATDYLNLHVHWKSGEKASQRIADQIRRTLSDV